MAVDARSRWFLIAVGSLFLVAFALPLFAVPYEWAEWFGWDTRPRTDLGAYFGRCLGAVALAITVLALAASRAPERHPWVFSLLALAALLLAAVHLRGLIEDSQPAVEHAETAAYLAFAGAAWWCRPRTIRTPN